jgi:hypothetical protein
MTVQEETSTMPAQKEENNAQIDVEIGIDGGAAELMGTKEEAASSAESKSTASEGQKHMSKRMLNQMAASDDPFAIREGKTLLWTNVNMVLVSQSSIMMKYLHTILIDIL